MWRFPWIVSLVPWLFGLPAWAEATELVQGYDMQLPKASVASCDSPLSVVFNPAALSWGASGDILFLHQESLAAEARASGLFFKTNAFGFGLQWVRLGNQEQDYLKYTLAAPLLTAGRWLSIGYGVEILDPTETAEDPSLDWLVGATLRPLRYLSLGVVGRNLAKAGIVEKRSERSIDLGMAVRPLWFAPERATLAVDFNLREGVREPGVRFTGQLALVDGINLFGNADLAGNFAAGLMVDFQRFGVGSYLGVANDSGLSADNLTLMVRASRENYPGFFLWRGKTAVFVLDRDLVIDEQPVLSFFKNPRTLSDLERAIRRAAVDPSIDSVLLKVEDPELRITDVQELRDALQTFKGNGKKVFFHLQQADNLGYYLATIGDAIFHDPGGQLAVTGPKLDAYFFRGTLDLLGIKAEFERVGDYKSAVEQLANKAPSEPYREVMKSLADELGSQMIEAIADGRNLSREKVQELVDQGWMSPQEAKSSGLVDDVLHFDELDGALERLLGHLVNREEVYLSKQWHEDRWSEVPIVAVVHVAGTITYGESVRGGVDARQIAGILSSLRDAPGVDAVVLRIDSPGGSGMASELIWREMVRLRERKPVIVSMSGLAASGGYYISCPADVIVADPSTITGSIGVFALFFDLSELYSKLGVSHEVQVRGKRADIESTFRGRTPEEMELVKKLVADFYRGFIERVASGRKLTTEEVDQIGRGRVWTGRQAKERGLVDELGGLSKAIRIARERIGLKPGDTARVIHYPRPRFSLGVLLQELGATIEEPLALPPLLRGSIAQMALLSTLASEPIVAMLPFLIEVH